MSIQYLTGFGNEFESEAINGALPKNQNAPQKVPFGLYAEQLSGTSFTTPRKKNLRTWFYRIMPCVNHKHFKPCTQPFFLSYPLKKHPPTPPHRFRWNPLPKPVSKLNFLESLTTVAGNGGVSSQTGVAIHIYSCNQSMKKQAFYNADGAFLIVPQSGALSIQTEFGFLEMEPGEVCVLQRGMKFSVSPLENYARGYVCENYGAHFELPELGTIGANGLAYPRHFQIPTTHYEASASSFKLFCKFQGHLWKAEQNHSPFDVVAWHGNYVPYKYDLRKFQTVNTVSFDHCDPSIFTVLTSPSDTPGVANLDFVIFPERWSLAENTFRPPYYHRNMMSEFMGLIYGQYDAKQKGFVPGGFSIHNCMSAHGPDSETHNKASSQKLKPQYLGNTLAFMFETRFVFQLTPWALSTKLLQKDYEQCWSKLPALFHK
ncbi:MAG: homogentisate 1,2-dioxygenase [Deltaproteobacteria bacterium]|nr:homogentisate 1,2-dioxygenase [Deltaproteobacteria bacterium]